MSDNAEKPGVKIFFNDAGEIQFEIKGLTPKQLLKVVTSLDVVKNIFLQSIMQRMEHDEKSNTNPRTE